LAWIVWDVVARLGDYISKKWFVNDVVVPAVKKIGLADTMVRI
jgi:hypothetical protein